MARSLILVRHPPVARAWAGRCYGQSDMGLSRAGQAMARALVGELAALRPDAIIHSDMRRTRALALPLARRLGITPVAMPLWRERHFGAWEGQTWNAIYRATGNMMDGMIDDPHSFRPGTTGETTCELFHRTAAALARAPQRGVVVIITHGGPIACARAAHAGEGLAGLAERVPPTGSVNALDS
ncbi:histidine phosphatase family protein [Novosphingobium sp.]|uniref:histidine phosphatase family protein n=1 Tax=Novosphingobium sp. TaxID=1874826 RepID=UPI003BA86FEF